MVAQTLHELMITKETNYAQLQENLQCATEQAHPARNWNSVVCVRSMSGRSGGWTSANRRREPQCIESRSRAKWE